MIGTSTNLVSHGLLQRAGMPGLGFFELSAVGVPCAILGIMYLVRVAPHLLTDRIPVRTVGDDVRRYLVELRLTAHSGLVRALDVVSDDDDEDREGEPAEGEKAPSISAWTGSMNAAKRAARRAGVPGSTSS